MTHYSFKEPVASLVALPSFQAGGGLWELFETRPLEEILQEMAAGWDSVRSDLIDVTASVTAYNSNYEL